MSNLTNKFYSHMYVYMNINIKEYIRKYICVKFKCTLYLRLKKIQNIRAYKGDFSFHIIGKAITLIIFIVKIRAKLITLVNFLKKLQHLFILLVFKIIMLFVCLYLYQPNVINRAALNTIMRH